MSSASDERDETLSRHSRRERKSSRRVTTIATRAMMAAQMAVATRTEIKNLLKNERRRGDGVPIYYAQNLATLGSRAVELAGECAAAALATLEHLDIDERRMVEGGQKKNKSTDEGREAILIAADSLSQSAAHEALAAKHIYEAMVAALASRGPNVPSLAAATVKFWRSR